MTCVCIFSWAEYIYQLLKESHWPEFQRLMSGLSAICSTRGSVPGLGRSPGDENGNPLQYSSLENSTDKRSLADYSPQGHEESDMTERLTHKLHLDFVLQSAVLICQASLPFFLVIAPPLWLGNRETFLWIPQWCLKIFSFHLLLNPEKVILELSALFPHTTPLWRSLPRGARTAGKSGSTQIFWGQLQPSLPPFHPSTEEVTTVVWRRKRWDGPYRTQGCKAWFGRTDFWSCTEGMNSGASRISPGGSLSKACTARRAEAQG